MSRSRKRRDEAAVSFFSFQDIIASVTGIMLLITLLLVLELVVRSEGVEQTVADVPSVGELTKQVDQKREELLALKRRLGELDHLLERVAQGLSLDVSKLDELERNIQLLRDSQARITRDIQAKQPQILQVQQEVQALEQRLQEMQSQVDKARQFVQARKSAPRVTLLGGDVGALRGLFVEFGTDAIQVGVVENQLARKIVEFRGADASTQFIRWAGRRSPNQEYFVLLMRPGGVGQFASVHKTLSAMNFKTGWDVWPEGKHLFRGTAP